MPAGGSSQLMVFTGCCRTYRKRGKHTATPVKKRKQERSRKQRVSIKSYRTYIHTSNRLLLSTQSYERRGKMVKEGREASLWAEVTPDMMSKEEQDGEVYVRHAPSYHLNALNRFISTLDHRLDTDLPKTSHPRLDKSPSLRSQSWISTRQEYTKWIVKKELWVNAGDIDDATEQGNVDASDSDSA